MRPRLSLFPTSILLGSLCCAAMACSKAADRGAAADSPAAAATTEPGDTAAARTGVERAIAGLGDAIGRSDAPAVAAYYTEDTYVHQWGSPPLRGRQAVLSIWEGILAEVKFDHPGLSIERFAASGPLAVSSGILTGGPRIRKADGRPLPPDSMDIRYVAAWARQPDARWLLRELEIADAPRAPRR